MRRRYRIKPAGKRGSTVVPPKPRVVSTRVEVDLAELHITPALLEPSAYCRAVALNNAGLFQAYMSVGFYRTEAFQLLQQQLDAVMHQGHR